MKKKVLALVMAAAMTISLAACGGNGGSADGGSTDSGSDTTASTDDGGSADADSGDYDLRLLNGKPEINDQLEELAKLCEEETGLKVNIETIGGDTSAGDELKKMYQQDNMPDIFVIEANQADTWDGMLVDLAGEEWTDKTGFELVHDSM